MPLIGRNITLIMIRGIFISTILIIAAHLSVLYGQTTITYEKSDEIIFNPERGFSKAQSSAITKTLINSVKAAKISVIQRIYTIPQFVDKPLSDDFLALVEKDFNTARENGVKLVVRFSYTNDQDGKDAALDTIKLHITQLTPILQDNYDVIAYMEAGFIGAWGEWYYSTHNLNNTTSRRDVLFSLLNALPEKRAVVVRTPDYKRKIFNSAEPITLEEAFNGSNKSRTGAHNDCFLASETDYGTYLDNSIEGDKNYLNQDNRFVPQGGETCCDCGFAGGANALTDLARMHWSVINKDYHPAVLQRWTNEGIMDEVKRRLGYRFELISAVISDSVKPGGEFNLRFKLNNAGFASPYNPRNLEVILRDSASGKKYRLLTENDPRFWFSGDTVDIVIKAGMPNDMPEGEYAAFLFLSDPEPELHEKADYAMRLANAGIWEDSTGYNFLKHKVAVTSLYEAPNYIGDSFFEIYKSSIGVVIEDFPVTSSIKYDIKVYPNPFNSSVVIRLNGRREDVTGMGIYNILGKRITTFDPEQTKTNIIWDAKDSSGGPLSSGIYFFVLKTKSGLVSKKLMLLK